MSGGINENWRVVTATVFATVLIVGAFVMTRGLDGPQVAQASDETQILKAIATKDNDKDGLPDWEEPLYGTDPHNPDTFKLGITDGEAVAKGLIVPKAAADIVMATSTNSVASIDPSLPSPPADGTLTAAFAQNFFTLYMAAKQKNGGVDLTDTDVSNIVNQAISNLQSSIKPVPDFKTARDLNVSGSGQDALKAFADQAMQVLMKNEADATTTEINYFKYALVGNDAAAYGHMRSIAKVYHDCAVGISVLPVPRELASADLELVNSLMHLSQIITDLTRVDSDTLAAILALREYSPQVGNLGKSFSDIAAAYKAGNVVLPAGSAAAAFVNVKADVVAAEAKAPLPAVPTK